MSRALGGVRAPTGEGPGPGDQVPVPAQQGRGRDQEDPPALPAEQAGQAGQHGAVSGGVPRPCDLAAQDCQLVTTAPGSSKPMVQRCLVSSKRGRVRSARKQGPWSRGLERHRGEPRRYEMS